MELQSTREHNNPCGVYPLNLAPEEPDLQCLYAKFGESLPSLFVSESKDCSVEVLGPVAEGLSASSSNCTNQPNPTQSLLTAGVAKLRVDSPTTLKGLEDILQVIQPGNIIDLRFTHCRKSYQSAASGYCKCFLPLRRFEGQIRLK